jgi:hypothetical protein
MNSRRLPNGQMRRGYRPPSFWQRNSGMIGIGIICVIGLLLLGSCAVWSNGNRQTVSNVTVTDKDRVCDGVGSSRDCRYLVYTNKGVFENTDSLANGKFNSSDVQGRITVGGTYTFVTIGHRVPFLSSYANIIEVR